jgi:hypothetical protein
MTKQQMDLYEMLLLNLNIVDLVIISASHFTLTNMLFGDVPKLHWMTKGSNVTKKC